MRKIGWLSVALSLLAYLVLAVAGNALGYLYERDAPSTLRRNVFVDVFVGRAANAFPGGYTDSDAQVRWAAAWLVGLVIGLVVLAVFVLVASRSGSGFALFTGAWLGTVLGTALAGIPSTLIVLAYFTDAARPDSLQWGVQSFFGLQHGLYWGAVTGWLVGLVALLGNLGRRRRTTFAGVPSPDSSFAPPR